jgi:anti-anti-sigma factor
MSLPETPNLLPLEGEIDLHVAPRIDESLRRMLGKRPPRLVVDLSRVTYIDSSGLAVLIAAAQDIEVYGGRLMLAGAQQNVRSIIESSGLGEFFLAFPHVDAAFAAT